MISTHAKSNVHKKGERPPLSPFSFSLNHRLRGGGKKREAASSPAAVGSTGERGEERGKGKKKGKKRKGQPPSLEATIWLELERRKGKGRRGKKKFLTRSPDIIILWRGKRGEREGIPPASGRSPGPLMTRQTGQKKKHISSLSAPLPQRRKKSSKEKGKKKRRSVPPPDRGPDDYQVHRREKGKIVPRRGYIEYEGREGERGGRKIDSTISSPFWHDNETEKPEKRENREEKGKEERELNLLFRKYQKKRKEKGGRKKEKARVFFYENVRSPS